MTLSCREDACREKDNKNMNGRCQGLLSFLRQLAEPLAECVESAIRPWPR